MDPRKRTWAEVNATRRSIKTYTGEVVTPELVREIVAEAHLAPSEFNAQPWRVLVAQGEALEPSLPALGNTNGGRVREAGTLVTIWADMAPLEGREKWYPGPPVTSREEWAARNGALLAMNLMAAAWSHGVATRPMSGFDPAQLIADMSPPETWHPVLVMAMGYADGEPEEPRDRIDVDEVLRFA